MNNANFSAAASAVQLAREAFAPLAPLPRWVPYAARPSARRPGKVDKIPSNGNVGLSTARPDDWCGLDEALGLSMVHPDLNGVGLVMTKGIEQDGLLLIGFDFDGLDPAKLKPALDEIEPLVGYVELSPSGNGLRAFAWVEKSWVEKYKDSMKAHPGFCDHAEIYFGTSPRFLTVTFNAQRTSPIKTLDEKAKRKIESWGLTPRGAERDETAPILDTGTPLELSSYRITDKQKKLLTGQPNIDRSDILHGLIISLSDQGAPAEDILATITSNAHLWRYALDHRHDDPERALNFAKDEVQRGIANSKTAKVNRLTAINEKWKPSLTPKSLSPAKPEAPPSWPEPFPGVMDAVATATLEVAAKPQRPLTALATLIGMAAVCGSNYVLPGGGRLNLYGCGVAGTGEGKENPRALAVVLACQGLVDVIGMPASGEGLEDALVDHCNLLIEVDEIGHCLAAANGEAAPPHLTALIRILLRLYTVSSGVYSCRVRASAKPREEGKLRAPLKASRNVKNPALSLIGFATPGKLGRAVTLDNIEEGLLGRLLFAFGEEGLAPRRVRAALRLPPEVITRARTIGRRRLFGDIQITVSDDADRLLDQLLQEFDRHRAEATSPFARALFVRSFEKAERIAGVLAVWDNPAKPVINLEHVQWAAQAVRASDAALLRFAEDFLHTGCVQADAAKLRTLIPRIVSGELTTGRAREQEVTRQGWAPRSMLLRASKLDKMRFDIALAHLEGLGDVQFQTFQGEHPNGREERLQAVRGSTD